MATKSKTRSEAKSRTNHNRKTIDCRAMPDSKCSVTISGTEQELMPLAVHHAVTSHGYQDGPELRSQLREMMMAAR